MYEIKSRQKGQNLRIIVLRFPRGIRKYRSRALVSRVKRNKRFQTTRSNAFQNKHPSSYVFRRFFLNVYKRRRTD